jgi:hypothetical protein
MREKVHLHKSGIMMLSKAINQTGRAIVLSTSPGETLATQAAHDSRNVEKKFQICGVV